MIKGEHMERAEGKLSMAYQITHGVTSDRVLYDRTGVDPDALDKLIAHHKNVFFKQYAPDIDPRLEPSIVTMFRHFFCVGALSQKLSRGDDS